MGGRCDKHFAATAEQEQSHPSVRAGGDVVTESMPQMAGAGALPGCLPKKTSLLASLAPQPGATDPGVAGSIGYANLCK